MNTPNSTNMKSPTSAELGNWYDDSLSLVSQKPHKSSKRPFHPPEALIGKGIGLAVFKNCGETIWKYGEHEKCTDFMDSSKFKTRGIHHDNDLIEPYLGGLIVVGKGRNITRVVSLDGSALAKILEHLCGEVSLSKSELRLLIQILCGTTLKDAAHADNVTYETKRSQFKSLAARTGFNTQNEVIRKVLLGLMTHVMDLFHSINSQTPHDGDETSNFLNLYYPNLFRYHQIEMDDRQTLRIADMGPVNGNPVIWLHSQTLPCPDQLLSEWTYEKNIRFIIPLREGFLEETQAHYSKASHIDRCTKDLVAVAKHFCGGSARLVANSTGVPYAINMAVKYPQYVNHITFCASSYVGRYDNKPVRKMVNGIKNLITKNELLIDRMFERYLSKMSSLAGILEVLNSSYKDSNWDMEVFTALLGNPVNHSWMYESYCKSRHSVVLDVAMGGYDVWKNVAEIGCDTLFVHGELDPINLAEDAIKMAELIPGSKFLSLKDQGQSLFLTQLSEIVGMGHL